MASIEWLKKELEDYGSPSHLNLDWSTFDELIEQAKEMHKQEIIDFVYKAVRKILDEERDNPFNLEQYYQETFGSKGSDECIFFIPPINTTSATICANCGREKFLHKT